MKSKKKDCSRETDTMLHELTAITHHSISLELSDKDFQTPLELAKSLYLGFSELSLLSLKTTHSYNYGIYATIYSLNSPIKADFFYYLIRTGFHSIGHIISAINTECKK